MHQSQVIWAVLWSYKMTMLSSMLCQTTPATLISLHVQYLTAYQGVATLSLAQKARLSKWRDRCLVPVIH